MKKFLIALMSIAMISATAFGFASCSDDEEVAQGPQGIQGVKGDKGDKGDTGVGVQSVTVDANGNLVITLTDGTTQTVAMPESNQSDVPAGYSEGLAYMLSEDGSYYILRGFGACEDNEIKIPATYKGKPVKEIGEYALSSNASEGYGWYGIKSVEIPDSVTSIGDDAFEYCSSLTSVVIPDSVTSIGDDAFNGCNGLMIYCEAVSQPSGWSSSWNDSCPVIWDCNNNEVAEDGYIYTAVDGIRYAIKDGVAMVVKQPRTITKAIIPASITYKNTAYSVTSIGERAFYSCDSLTSVVIPDSITSIGERAFAYCYNLTSVVIPDSVISIGDEAFYYCTSLTSVVIGDSVTSIGDEAFAYCRSLTSVEIGDSVTSIGDLAFYDCYSLASITFNGTLEEWNAISKGSSWKYDVPATEVVCSDGTVSI